MQAKEEKQMRNRMIFQRQTQKKKAKNRGIEKGKSIFVIL